MTKAVANKSGGGRRGSTRYATIDRRLCVTVPEAAEMLTISRNNAYKLVREGVIPSKKLGERIVIPRVALEKMLENGVPE
jgi:excisionase family DNA binding protein